MKKGIVILLLISLLFGVCACQKQIEEQQRGNRTVSSFDVPGLLEYCLDEQGEYLYCTIKGSSSLYKYTVQGEFVAEIPVTVDEAEKIVKVTIEEQETGIGCLSGLCINGDILYCYRSMKNTLIGISLKDGTDSLLGKPEDVSEIRTMVAGDNTLLVQKWNMDGKEELLIWDLHTSEEKQVPFEGILTITHETADSYWLAGYEEELGYYLQEYDAISGTFSEKYATNLMLPLLNMVYVEDENAIYGFEEGIGQYIRLIPRQADSVIRFQAQHTYDGEVRLEKRGEKLYIQDSTLGKIYYFDASAYIADNVPLKGYVLDIATVQDYAGYDITLEVLSWEELALKVLAGDTDYDFVILNTAMPEALALRDALAYAPIPEEYIAQYWQECQPCIKEAALHGDEIWMLPLNLQTEGIIYNEENMRQHGIDMEQIRTLPEWYAAAKQLYEAGYEDYYALNYPANTVLYAYIYERLKKGEIDFNTKEFEEILDFFVGENGNRANFWHLSLGLNWMTYPGNNWEEKRAALADDILMDCERMGTAYAMYQGRENLQVRSIPPMPGEEELVQVWSDILILNPNAPNKKDVLAFARDISRMVIENPENWISADRECYPSDAFTGEVLKLYGKGELIFGLPEELFSCYYAYLSGEKTDKQAVMEELNRTVRMYLGE